MTSETNTRDGEARKFALVTGASSGIGRAIAVALGCAGFAVLLTGRRREALEETAAMILPGEGCAAAIPADLADDAELEALVHRVHVVTDSRLAVLVNCAGCFHLGPFEETPLETLDQVLRLNFRAPFALTQALIPALRTGEGSIVFVNSTVALNAPARLAAYSASKAALKALADSMRDEYAGEHLRILSVFPGRTDTPMGQQASVLEGRELQTDHLVQPEDVAAAVVTAVTLPPRAQVTNLQVSPGRRMSTPAPAPVVTC